MKPSSILLRQNKFTHNQPHKRLYSKKITPPQLISKVDQQKLIQKDLQSIPSIISRNSRGTGGRSSISGIVATVFGASGFLGRYVVNELGKVGSQVVVAYRGEENAQRHLKVMGDLGQIVPLQCDVNDSNSIEEVISRSNVVINLIGKRWSTNNYSLNAVNNVIPENIAKVAKKVGIERFIHVSALGSSPNSPSEFLRTKYAGEVAVRNAFPEAVIVRPASVFGHEDRVLNKYASICARWPFIPILKGYEKRKEAYISHSDFATAIYRIVIAKEDEKEGSPTYDLGGDEVTTEDLLDSVKEWTLCEKKTLAVPLEYALEVVKFTQHLRRSRFTVDEVRALTEDIVVNPADNHKTFADLNIQPSSMLNLVPRFVKHFRNPVTMMDTMYETRK